MTDAASYAIENGGSGQPADRGSREPHGSIREVAMPVDTGINSEVLLRGRKAVAIKHNGLIYRLQATRLGKLILTK